MDYVLLDSAKSTLSSRQRRSRSSSPATVPSFLQSTVCSESDSIFKAGTPRDDLLLGNELASNSPNSSRSAATFDSMTPSQGRPSQGRLRGRGLTYEGQLL